VTERTKKVVKELEARGIPYPRFVAGETPDPATFTIKMLKFAKSIGKGQEGKGEFHQTLVKAEGIGYFGAVVYDTSTHWVSFTIDFGEKIYEARILERNPDFPLEQIGVVESAEPAAVFTSYCMFLIGEYLKRLGIKPEQLNWVFIDPLNT
jgi:hypothetical protein